jgi:MFS family permease
MLLDFFSTFFSSAYALLPIFAQDILHVGPQGLGILFAAPGIGAVLAGLVMAHMHNIKKQGMILLASVGVYGFATILFGVSTSFTLSLLALFLIGAGDSISAVIRNTVRQIATPDHMRGRMTGVNMIFFKGGPQLGEFEAGLLASALGGPWSVVIGGIGTIVAVGVMAFFIPTLRKYQGDEVFK